MPTSDISVLKAKQDKRTLRKQRLLAAFTPFRDGLFAQTEAWVADAIAQGMERVVPCKRQSLSAHSIELTCMVNGFALIFVADSGVVAAIMPQKGMVFQPIESLPIVARIFVYLEEHEDRAPDFDLRVYEQGDDYHYDMASDDASGGWKMIRHGQPTEQAGRDLAHFIIGYVSEFTDTWRDAPTLGAMRNRPGKGHPLGFTPSSATSV